MATIETAVVAIHLLFAGLWVGAVGFVTISLLPLGREGQLDPDPFERSISQLTLLSRSSAVVLLLTGGHLSTVRYEASEFLGTLAGRLVLAMVVLWIVLMALVEVGSNRLFDGFAEGKIREPARDATNLYRAASVVGIALLLIGGVLTAGRL